jgi:flagellin
MTIINTNVKALFAHQALKINDRSMTDSMQQLSTGKRINSAKDDAAGLAIGTRMTADLRGLAVAIRNANDGISMMQTAEGALGEISNMLQRMRELAVQAANGTMSRSNREALQAELDQLVLEIDNVAKTTNFNGIKLLDGSTDPIRLQTGVREGEQVQVGIVDARAKSLGLQGYMIEGELTSGRVGRSVTVDDGLGGTTEVEALTQLDNNSVLINGKPAFAAGVNLSTMTEDYAENLASAINTNLGQHEVKASAFNTLRGFAPTAQVFEEGALSINGKAVGSASSVEELVSNINRDVPGVTATLSTQGTVELSNDTGAQITISGVRPDGTTVGDGESTTAGFLVGTYQGYITMDSLSGKNIKLFANNDANGFPSGTGTVEDLQSMGLNESTSGDKFTGGAVSSEKLTVEDDIRINGIKLGASIDGQASSKAAAINALSETTGVKATALTEAEVTFVGAPADGLTINGIELPADLDPASAPMVAWTASDKTMSDLVTLVNDAEIGVFASTSESGRLILRSPGGVDIKVKVDGVQVTSVGSVGGSAATADANDVATIKGRVTLFSDIGAEIRVEAAEASHLEKLGLAPQGGTSVLVGGALTIVTQDAAGKTMTVIDRALDRVLVNRATLGAFQNRMTVAIDSLMTTSNALNQSRSRIMDADYAQVSTELARNQIIQQAATAILAQANTSQQTVMQLIQG